MKLPHPLAPTTPEALLGVFAALVNAALRVAIIPLFVTPVFDRVIGARDLSALPGVLGVAAVVVGVGALALFWQDALLGRAAAKIAARWREGLYASLLARAPGTLPGTSGGLTGRILTDLKEVETYTQYGLGTLVAETFTLLGIFGVLFYYNARATLILIGLGVPLVLVLALLGRHLQQVARHSQAGLEEVGAHLQEGLRHHAVIRALAATPFMLNRFHKANTATERSTVRRSALAALQTPVAQLLIFGAVALLVALLAKDVAAGALSPGETIAYLVLVLLLATPAQLLPKGYALLQQARAASERLNELVKAREIHTPDSSGVTLSPTSDTGLELRKVSFGYTPNTPLLDTLSFTLPRHSLVALVGESGSGKTTLLQLLLRFLEPGAGAIFLGGSPLASLSEDELRRRLSYVPQSPDLVRGTVLDNLVLGRGYDEDDVWAALRAVGLEATVRDLPGALGYMLREDGSGLSGGQRQRLAVARALLSEPEVLLLDEPSANLDAESESVLVTTLKRQAERRLVLVVAHRPALVEAANLVLRLSETGRVRLESRAQEPIL